MCNFQNQDLYTFYKIHDKDHIYLIIYRCQIFRDKLENTSQDKLRERDCKKYIYWHLIHMYNMSYHIVNIHLHLQKILLDKIQDIIVNVKRKMLCIVCSSNLNYQCTLYSFMSMASRPNYLDYNLRNLDRIRQHTLKNFKVAEDLYSRYSCLQEDQCKSCR